MGQESTENCTAKGYERVDMSMGQERAERAKIGWKRLFMGQKSCYK